MSIKTGSRVSLRDVAREAGVSLKTASRVLNGENATSQTAQRVRSTIQNLNYRPNLAAGAVFGRLTRTVGVMIPFSYDGSFYGKIVKAAHDELVVRNYAPILLFATPELNLKQQIHRLVDRRVDGILLRPMYEHIDEVLLAEILERDIPLVTVMKPTALAARVDFVGNNNRRLGELAAIHLLKLGHRRSVLMTYTAAENIESDDVMNERWFGFRTTMEAAGCEPLLHCRVRNSCTAFEMAQEILGRYPEATAIFTPIDRLSLGVYKAAAEKGLRIPHDLSVLGAGNLDFAAELNPALTTFDQNPEKIGSRAALALMDRIEKNVDTGRTIEVEMTLIERESTAFVERAERKES